MLVLYFLVCLCILPFVNGAHIQDGENQIQNILKRLEYVENEVKLLETENQDLKLKTNRYGNCYSPPLSHLRLKIQTTAETQRYRMEETTTNQMTRHQQKPGLLLRQYINQIVGHQAIEFDMVSLNDGNTYSPLHDHMIAPVRGVYLLSFSIYTDPQTSMAFEVVLNGQRIDTMYADASGLSRGMSQSRTYPILLEKGDMVWLRTYPGFEGGNVYGASAHYNNSFSGVLLYEKSN